MWPFSTETALIRDTRPSNFYHQISIILHLSQFNSKDFKSLLRSRQYPNPLTTSSPWLSGRPQLLSHCSPWLACPLLTVFLYPFRNPPKESSLGFPLWSLFSLFLVIFAVLISKFTSTNDSQIFIYSDSMCPKANSPSSISSQAHAHFLHVSVHGITILSTFQAWNLRDTLVPPLSLAPQCYIL